METAVQESPAESQEQSQNGDASNVITVTAGTKAPESPHADENGKISATVEFNPGADLEEAIEMYGEKTVFDLYARQADRDLSNAIRSRLSGGTSPEQTELELADWRPDQKTRRTRSKKSLLDEFEDMEGDQQQQLIRQLMEKAGLAE